MSSLWQMYCSLNLLPLKNISKSQQKPPEKGPTYELLWVLFILPDRPIGQKTNW